MIKRSYMCALHWMWMRVYVFIFTYTYIYNKVIEPYAHKYARIWGKCGNQDEKATKASQAVNSAWAVLRDPKAREGYNQSLLQKAIAAEKAVAARKLHSQIATSQRAPQAKPKAKPKASGSKKPATAASSSKQPDPTSSQHGDPEDSWVYCKLIEQKQAVVCKSLLAKTLVRKFEHKSWAGGKHALCVALEFQKTCEKLVGDSLQMKKLDDLKQFCSEHGIELPTGTRLSKLLLSDTIEEAGLTKPFLSFVCTCKCAPIWNIHVSICWSKATSSCDSPYDTEDRKQLSIQYLTDLRGIKACIDSEFCEKLNIYIYIHACIYYCI